MPAILQYLAEITVIVIVHWLWEVSNVYKPCSLKRFDFGNLDASFVVEVHFFTPIE